MITFYRVECGLYFLDSPDLLLLQRGVRRSEPGWVLRGVVDGVGRGKAGGDRGDGAGGGWSPGGGGRRPPSGGGGWSAGGRGRGAAHGEEVGVGSRGDGSAGLGAGRRLE